MKTLLLAAFACTLLILSCKKPEMVDPPPPVQPEVFFRLDTVKYVLDRSAIYYTVTKSSPFLTLKYVNGLTKVTIMHRLEALKEGTYTNMQDFWDSTEVECTVSGKLNQTSYKYIQGGYKIEKHNGKFVSVIGSAGRFYDTYRWKDGELRIEWP